MICQSRIETSLKIAYPATWSSASAFETWRPPRPMITASSASQSTALETLGTWIGAPSAMSDCAKRMKRLGSESTSSFASAACSA